MVWTVLLTYFSLLVLFIVLTAVHADITYVFGETLRLELITRTVLETSVLTHISVTGEYNGSPVGCHNVE